MSTETSKKTYSPAMSVYVSPDKREQFAENRERLLDELFRLTGEKITMSQVIRSLVNGFYVDDGGAICFDLEV